jgi:hypothetical protein
MYNENTLQNYNFYISSSQRESGTPSNFRISLPQPILLNGIVPSNFVLYVDRAQIPLSFNQFNELAENIQTEWSMVRNSTTYTGTFNIDSGNYSILSLASHWIVKLRESITTVLPSYTPSISYTYSEDTNKLRFFLTGTTNTVITILYTNYTRLSNALGFGANWTLDASANYTQSTQDCNVGVSRALYITSTSLIQNTNWSALNRPLNLSNTITYIPITHSRNLYIQHNPPNPIRTALLNNTIDEIQLTLRDELIDEVDGMLDDWICHILIQEVRSIPVITELYRNMNLQYVSGMREKERELRAVEQFRKEQEDEINILLEHQRAEVKKLVNKIIRKKK